MSRKFKVQIKHYTFQTIMCLIGLGTFSLIVFTLITIISQI